MGAKIARCAGIYIYCAMMDETRTETTKAMGQSKVWVLGGSWAAAAARCVRHLDSE